MIGPPEHTWMLCFRVDDLDAMVADLRGAGRRDRFPPLIVAPRRRPPA